MYGAYVTLLRTPITVAARAYTDKSCSGTGDGWGVREI